MLVVVLGKLLRTGGKALQNGKRFKQGGRFHRLFGEGS